MSEIIKNKLYLGDIYDANNQSEINNKNISCIICVAEEAKINNTNPNVKLIKYNLQDNYECNIYLYFDEIADIIHREKSVLVNCMAGISRSPTIVIAYIMKYYKLNLKDAFLEVRNRRNIICPNKQFMDYLLQYEFTLYGKNSLTYNQCIQLFFYT